MQVQELVLEMKLLERRMALFEEKYGMLSADFYGALTSGSLARYDEFDETRADFSRWKGLSRDLAPAQASHELTELTLPQTPHPRAQRTAAVPAASQA
jgi:hypothetical protein